MRTRKTPSRLEWRAINVGCGDWGSPSAALFGPPRGQRRKMVRRWRRRVTALIFTLAVAMEVALGPSQQHKIQKEENCRLASPTRHQQQQRRL